MNPFARYLAEIERLRPPEGTPENLVVVARVDSTNRVARSIVASYEEEAETLRPLLILAHEQTGGRGRLGRGWASPSGRGVYATRVMGVDDPEALQLLPLLVGIGLCRALEPLLSAPCRLKWPNDLLVETAAGPRKIGGILIEALVRPGLRSDPSARALIGFGVNHSHDAADLPETGTSLQLLGADLGLEELTWRLVEGVERELPHLLDAAYAAEQYRARSIHRPGDRIACRTGENVVEGVFAGFDEHGRLRLDVDGREVRLAAGELIESGGSE